MRGRYLFSADRKANEYRDVLEVTEGHARLVTPSAAARMLRWIVSIGYFVLYTTVIWAIFLGLAIGIQGAWMASWPLDVVAMALWFVGLIAVMAVADRRTLPLLADSPAERTELVLMGARSFGTYQEVRARTFHGAELKLIVDARSERFWEAVKLLEARGPAPQ